MQRRKNMLGLAFLYANGIVAIGALSLLFGVPHMNEEPKISRAGWVLLIPVWLVLSALIGTGFLAAAVWYLEGTTPSSFGTLFSSAKTLGVVISYLVGGLGSALVIGQSLGYRTRE